MSNAPREQPDESTPDRRTAETPGVGRDGAQGSDPHRKSVPGFDPAEKPGTGPQSPNKAE